MNEDGPEALSKKSLPAKGLISPSRSQKVAGAGLVRQTKGPAIGWRLFWALGGFFLQFFLCQIRESVNNRVNVRTHMCAVYAKKYKTPPPGKWSRTRDTG